MIFGVIAATVVLNLLLTKLGMRLSRQLGSHAALLQVTGMLLRFGVIFGAAWSLRRTWTSVEMVGFIFGVHQRRELRGGRRQRRIAGQGGLSGVRFLRHREHNLAKGKKVQG